MHSTVNNHTSSLNPQHFHCFFFNEKPRIKHILMLAFSWIEFLLISSQFWIIWPSATWFSSSTICSENKPISNLTRSVLYLWNNFVATSSLVFFSQLLASLHHKSLLCHQRTMKKELMKPIIFSYTRAKTNSPSLHFLVYCSPKREIIHLTLIITVTLTHLYY